MCIENRTPSVWFTVCDRPAAPASSFSHIVWFDPMKLTLKLPKNALAKVLQTEDKVGAPEVIQLDSDPVVQELRLQPPREDSEEEDPSENASGDSSGEKEEEEEEEEEGGRGGR